MPKPSRRKVVRTAERKELKRPRPGARGTGDRPGPAVRAGERGKRARSQGGATPSGPNQGEPNPGGPEPGRSPGGDGARESNGRKARPGNGQRRAARSRRGDPPANPLDMEETLRARELFWANVVREILCSLAEASHQAAEARARREAEARDAPPATAEGLAAEAGRSTSLVPPGGPPDVLDGRICIITNFGERIAVSEVKPLFAMGVDESPDTRALSMAVECSVFQVRTPKGVVFTLPIHEIRAVRALSEDLMTEIERERGEAGPERPFGFAAFTSMALRGLPGSTGLPPPEEEESHWE